MAHIGFEAQAEQDRIHGNDFLLAGPVVEDDRPRYV
jgi:hypothetical protein